MTIGDVLATVTGALAACASLWAALVLTGLLFERRTAAAAAKVEASPVRCIGAGALVAAVAGGVAVALTKQPNGLAKLAGWIGLAALTGLATVGGAGLARVVARRIRKNAPGLTDFGALGRAAGLLVAAGLIPFLGWLIAAVSLLANLGAAVLTLRRRREDAHPAAPAAAAAVAAAAGSEYALE